MKASELYAALAAELIRGNDPDVFFTVPLELMSVSHESTLTRIWYVNKVGYVEERSDAAYNPNGFLVNHRPQELEFRHREGSMEIVLS